MDNLILPIPTFQQKIKLGSDTTLVIKLQPIVQIKAKQKKDSELHAGAKADKKTEGRRKFKLF